MRITTAAAVLAGASLSQATLGGPLTPPGAPAPTMKTLHEVEPSIPISATSTPGDADATFVIALPGAYHLTGNMTGEVGKYGIQILTGNVTLDLRGHTMSGVIGSLKGIYAGDGAPLGLGGVVVQNGTLEDWGSSGVSLENVENTRVENIYARTNSGHGIRVDDSAIILDCIMKDNVLRGIAAGSGVRIEGCSVDGSTDYGITVANNSIILDCVVNDVSIDGILGGQQVTIQNCVLSNTGADGIEINSNGTVRSCTVNNAGTRGIYVYSICVIESCTIRTTGSFGIDARESNIVRNNTINNSNRDGIHVHNRNTIRDNNLDYIAQGPAGWAAAGIHVELDNNRIEGNNISRCDWGIRGFA
ncbi:MAG: right-handed parallel beta-helix repeat-containing protein, partial [Planctomycetota bacterium]